MLNATIYSNDYWVVIKAKDNSDKRPHYIIFPSGNQSVFNDTPPKASRSLTKIFDMYHGYNFQFKNTSERIEIHVTKTKV